MIRGHTRVGDALGRIGGEEFTKLLPDTALDEAEALSERLRLQVTRFDGGLVLVGHIAAEPALSGLARQDNSDGPVADTDRQLRIAGSPAFGCWRPVAAAHGPERPRSGTYQAFEPPMRRVCTL